MTLLLAIIFLSLFVLSVFIDVKQNMKFQKELNAQNLNIIFVNYDEMDIKAELFKKKDFFKISKREFSVIQLPR